MAATKVCRRIILNECRCYRTSQLSSQEATVILFDVGQHTGKSFRPGQPSFFEQAKQCLAKILQRKVNCAHHLCHLLATK